MERKKVTIQISPRLKIACEEYSKGDNSESESCKFIAIHGWLDNCATWQNFVPEFTKTMTNVKILCIDLAGHGRSSHRDSHTYLLTDYVVDLYHIVQALGWKRFGLVAHSLGGSVAVLFSGSWPEYVSELILIESLGPWTNPPSQAPANLRNSVEKVRFVPHVIMDLSPTKQIQRKKMFKSIEEAAIRRSRGNVVNKLPIEAARILCSRGLRRVNSGEFMWASDSALTDKSRFRLSDSHIRAFLSRIRAPTLLVMATNGMLEKVYSRFLISPFSFLGRILLRLALYVTYLYVCLFKSQDSKAKARLSGLRWCVNFCSRPSALSSTDFVLREIEVGGHHPHLTRADVVSRVVSSWRAKHVCIEGKNSLKNMSKKIMHNNSGEWEFVKKASLTHQKKKF